MKVMIHACPKRMWYVENFLIPQLQAQGITDIIVWNDEKKEGNLASFVNSSKFVKDNLNDLGVGIWHLQDDVLLSRNFKETAERMPDNIICNGISHSDGEDSKLMGLQPINKCWWSFQCIYIPNKILAGFYEWFIKKCLIDKKYQGMVKARKYDDYFFALYLRNKYKKLKCYNMVPNIVQHIDYLIGGRIANANLKMELRGKYWVEKELEEKLKTEIDEWRKKHDNA